MALKLHNFDRSGHSHRVRLMLSLLGLEYDCHDVDLAAGEHKSDAFLAMNPFGHVPVLEDDGVAIYDSTAILVYLSRKYDPSNQWFPKDPLASAHVQQWLSAASGEIAFGPAAARLVKVFGAGLDQEKAIQDAHAFFVPLDKILSQQNYLVGTQATIADIAAYTYISHAPEGDVSLAPYPFIREWLLRIESLPGFVGMTRTKVL